MTSKETEAKIRKLTREQCVRLLESASIQCYDHESVSVLRQAVRVNIGDGTIPRKALDEG